MRSSMLASPNDTVRVACVGVRGQGQSHIRACSRFSRMDSSTDAEKLTGKRPAGFTDLRKLLEDKSIDAISIATPNHNMRFRPSGLPGRQGRLRRKTMRV